jgi:tetratricopeptide (TPR) repeat protein
MLRRPTPGRLLLCVLQAALVFLAVEGAIATPLESATDLGLKPELGAENLERSIESSVPGKLPGALEEALQLLLTGKIDASIAKVRSFLATQPNSAPGHELLGAALALKGDVDGGLKELRRAVELDPKRSSAYTKIGDVMLARKEPQQARQYFQDAVKLDPTDRLPHQRLGLIYEREGNDAGAIAHYEKGVAGTSATYLGVKTNLARLYNTRGEFDKARALLEPPLAKPQPDANAHVVLGTSYLALRRLDDAVAQFQQGAKDAPGADGPKLGLGIAYRQKRAFEQSVAELNEVIRIKPKWSTGYYQLAETYLAMSRPKEAIEQFAKAEALSSNPKLVRRRMADAHVAMGDLRGAIAIYELLAEGKDAGPATLTALGTAYQLDGNPSSAEKVFVRIVKENPKDPGARLLLGDHYGFSRDYGKAIAVYRGGLQLAPKAPALWRALAVAYSRRGEGQKAVDAARRLSEALPGNTDAEFFLASLYDETGDTKAATSHYRKILAREPNHIASLNNLAMVLSAQGQHTEALKLARQAQGLAPKSAIVQDTYGWVLLGSGNAQDAVPALKAASALAPGNPSILYRLGAAQLRAGDREGAKASLEKAVQNSADFKEAEQTKKLLKGL